MKGFFRLYLRAQRRGMLFWGFCCLIFTVSFALYGLPLGAVLYPAALCAAAGGIILLLSLRKSRAVCQELSLMQHHPADLPDELPAAQSPQEQAYQALLLALHADRQKLKSNMNARYHDMTEYYTVWAHQIKTPIAAIRLALQNEDTPLSRRLTGEVGRVEQYVQMALTYLRLGSDSSDVLAPKEGTLLALLPEELRAVMKPCTKYTDNTGNSMEAAAVTATQEWLFLLSEWEYYGARTMANEGEQSFQQQYAYYAAGGSPAKMRHNRTTATARDWCRSPAAGWAGFCHAGGACCRLFTHGRGYPGKKDPAGLHRQGLFLLIPIGGGRRYTSRRSTR